MGLHLEAFDLRPAPEAPPPGPSPDWARGHAEGLMQGRALAEAEAAAQGDAAAAALAQAFADMAFTYAEARGAVLASLGPLFHLLADRLLPALAAEALVPRLVETLEAAAREDSACPLRLAVHPDRVAALRAALPPGMPAVVTPDPALGPQAARLGAAGRESALDLDACVAALREALAAVHHPDSPPQEARLA